MRTGVEGRCVLAKHLPNEGSLRDGVVSRRRESPLGRGTAKRLLALSRLTAGRLCPAQLAEARGTNSRLPTPAASAVTTACKMGCSSSTAADNIELREVPGGLPIFDNFGSPLSVRALPAEQPSRSFVVPSGGPLVLRMRKKAWSLGCNKAQPLAAQPAADFDVLSVNDGRMMFHIKGEPLSASPEVYAKTVSDANGAVLFTMTTKQRLRHSTNIETVSAADGRDLFMLANNFGTSATTKELWTQDLCDSSGKGLSARCDLKISGVVPRGTVWVATPDAVAMPVAKLRGESAYAGKMPQGKEKVNASEHDVYVIEIAPGMDAVVVLALVIGWEQFEVLDADRASRSAWIGHSPKNVTFQLPSPSGRAAIEC